MDKILLTCILLLVLQNRVDAALNIQVTNDAVLPGETATLTCIVSADNNELLGSREWREDNEVIGDSDRLDPSLYTVRDKDLGDGELVHWILERRDVTEDLDDIQCIVTSQTPGEAPLIQTAEIDVVSMEVTTPKYFTTGGAGTITWMSCKLDDLGVGRDPFVEWVIANNQQLEGDNFIITNDFTEPEKVSVLTIAGASADQLYTCRYNMTGGGSVRMEVLHDHALHIRLNNDAVLKGQTATLTCIVTADRVDKDRILQKDWFEGNTLIQPSDGSDGGLYSVRERRLRDNEILNWELERKEVTEDIKDIKCFVLTKEGASAEVNATIDYVEIWPYTWSSPDFRKKGPSNVTCILNNTMNPARNPIIEWWQDDTRIPINPGGPFTGKNNFSQINKEAVLNVTGVTMDQVYTCRFNLSDGGSVNVSVVLKYSSAMDIFTNTSFLNIIFFSILCLIFRD